MITKAIKSKIARKKDSTDAKDAYHPTQHQVKIMLK
jgi:hypothetical protein